MSAPRVEVWDPSGEGPWIVEGLRQEGIDAREIAVSDVVGTSADVVLLAGDAEGALAALKLLRDEGPHGDVPVILLGVPAGLPHEDLPQQGEGPAFGADAVFARPVPFAPLVRCVKLLASHAPPAAGSHVSPSPERASPERTMRLAGEADPGGSQVFLRGPWQPREPTMQLQDLEGASAVVPLAPPPSTGPGTGPGSRPGTGPREVPERLIPADARAELSPALEALLRAADRRVFPDRPPLVLHFPAANDSPAELVPQELLESAAFRIDEPVVEDPIDAFTYVGGPAVPPAIASGTPEPLTRDRETSPETPQRLSRPPGSLRPPPPEPTPIGVRNDPERTADWPADDTVLGRAAPDGSRRGNLGPGGALRLLWRVASLRLDTLLELTCEGGPSVRMTFLSGELRAFDGPIATMALDALRRRGRAVEIPADDAGAEAVLARRVEEGVLGRFERDRLMREAREALLHDLLRAERASFALRRLDDTEPGRRLFRARVLARPLRAALVDAARTALPQDAVMALLGSRPVGLALGPEREAGLSPAELPVELCELLVRMEGRSFGEIVAAAPTEPGLAGVLYALVAADVLVLTDPPESAVPPPETRAAVRSLVESAAALADDGDYFAILGIAPDAELADVERAHRARADELMALPLSLLELGSLEERRRVALDALDEARRALTDAGRRTAYAASLRA